jgi:hypothetical protein
VASNAARDSGRSAYTSVKQVPRYGIAGIRRQRGGKQHLVGDALSGLDDVRPAYLSDAGPRRSGRAMAVAEHPGNLDGMKRAGLTTTPESVPAR